MISLLFKINMKNLFQSLTKRSQKKASILRNVFFGLLLVYIVVNFVFLFVTFFWSLATPLDELGIGWYYFALNSLMVFCICVFESIFTVNGLLFSAKDNDSLLSMPITPMQILISRILTLLVTEYVFEAVISIPAFFVWIYFFRVSVSTIFCFIIAFAFLPLLSLSVGTFLAWLLSLVSSRMRNKNTVTFVLSMAFLAAYMYMVMNMQSLMERLMSRGTVMADALKESMVMFYHYGNAIVQGSFLSLFIFILWCVVPFGAVMSLLSRNFLRITAMNKNAPKVAYKQKRLEVSSALFALVKKEIARLWVNPMIILNVGFGSIMMIIAAFAVAIRFNQLMDTISELQAVIPQFSVGTLITVGLISVSCMGNASASSISLEGKNLWIAQSLPVPTKLLFYAKVLTHLIINALPCLILSLACTMVFARNVSDIAKLIIIPQAFNCLMAQVGLYVNLHLPKLDWISDLQPVKQGASAMFVMFGAMALIFGLSLLYLLVFIELSLDYYLWALTLIALILNVTLYRYFSGERAAERFLSL